MSHFLDAEIIGLAGKTKPTRISFDRHVNIIYGLNGSGKTSLLKILHSAMEMDPTPLRNVPFTEATVRVHSLTYKLDFTLQVKKSDLKLPEEVEFRLPSLEMTGEIGPQWDPSHAFYLGSPGSPGRKPPNWKRTPPTPDKSETGFIDRYLPTSRLHVSAERTSARSGIAVALTEELLDRYFADAVSARWAQYSAEVVRVVRDAQEKGLANILRGVLAGSGSNTNLEALDIERGYESTRRFLERQGSSTVLGTLVQFKKRFARNKSLQNVVKDVFQIEQAIDTALTPQRQLEGMIRKMARQKKSWVESGSGSLPSE
jgi:energy-coupling factor transporter ATP-binding protein EcfA2